MIAQLLGALVGSALVYANYFHAIDIVEGGRGIRTLKTAGLFSTYAVGVPPLLRHFETPPYSLPPDYQLSIARLYDECLSVLLRVPHFRCTHGRGPCNGRLREFTAAEWIDAFGAVHVDFGYWRCAWNGNRCVDD